MTKGEAKSLALKILHYRLEHPEIDSKEKLIFVFDIIKEFKNACPMCELFFVKDGKIYCPDCPLKQPKWKCNDYSKEAIANNIKILESWKAV